MAFAPGDAVQTPFGKGVVREVRNHRRVVVEVGGRSLTLEEDAITSVDEGRRRPAKRPSRSSEAAPAATPAARTSREVDLHGLTVDEALERSERALNQAILDDVAELRFIHGRSGGRIRDALHRWLSTLPVARHFRLDSRNDGVTIVTL